MVTILDIGEKDAYRIYKNQLVGLGVKQVDVIGRVRPNGFFHACVELIGEIEVPGYMGGKCVLRGNLAFIEVKFSGYTEGDT